MNRLHLLCIKSYLEDFIKIGGKMSRAVVLTSQITKSTCFAALKSPKNQRTMPKMSRLYFLCIEKLYWKILSKSDEKW